MRRKSLIFLEKGGRIGYIQTTVAGRDKKIPPFGSSLHNKAALKTSSKAKMTGAAKPSGHLLLAGVATFYSSSCHRVCWNTVSKKYR